MITTWELMLLTNAILFGLAIIALIIMLLIRKPEEQKRKYICFLVLGWSLTLVLTGYYIASIISLDSGLYPFTIAYAINAALITLLTGIIIFFRLNSPAPFILNSILLMSTLLLFIAAFRSWAGGDDGSGYAWLGLMGPGSIISGCLGFLVLKFKPINQD